MPTNNHKPVRYAGYIRVSSHMQVDGYSLDAQRHAIEDFVASRGDGTVMRWYEDAGESARTTHNRDAFLEMRHDASKGMFDVLVVHKFDRLNRNRMDATAVKALLRYDYNMKVLSVTEPSEDEDGPMGGMIEGILETYNDWFSKNLANEIRKGRMEKLNRGIYWGGWRPFGYIYKEDDGENSLFPHPEEAPIVKWMYETYLTGKVSLQWLADQLNKQGTRSTRGAEFSKEAVKQILYNPLYIGKLRYSETRYNHNGKRQYNVPKEYRDGNHEPLIDEETFNKVREIAKARSNNAADPRRKAYKKREVLLHGIIYCASCMAASEDTADDGLINRSKVRLHARTKTLAQGNEAEYVYYSCEKGHPFARTEVIDQEVVDYLLSDQFPEEWRESGIDAIAAAHGKDESEKRAQEIREIIERMDFRWDNGFITDTADYIKKRQELEAQLMTLEPINKDFMEQAADIINNFAEHWYACETTDERQKLIRLIVKKVFIQNRHIKAIQLNPNSVYIFPNREP